MLSGDAYRWASLSSGAWFSTESLRKKQKTELWLAPHLDSSHRGLV